MVNSKIEELAAEVLIETGTHLEDFAIEQVEEVARGTLRITFAWKKPIRVQVAVDLGPNDSNESVKAEIIRQLKAETG